MFHLSKDEEELVCLVHEYIEYLILAINPKLYEKIQQKKNAVEVKSDTFEEELAKHGISKKDLEEVFAKDDEKPEDSDEGFDIIYDPIELPKG